MGSLLYQKHRMGRFRTHVMIELCRSQASSTEIEKEPILGNIFHEMTKKGWRKIHRP
jgi:hypothetical protein